MYMNWISPRMRVPADGEEVLAVVTGQHGGFVYDHEVVNAIYDHGSWYLDDGVVDEAQTVTVSDWMPIPQPARRAAEPQVIEVGELINRMTLISASAGQWSGPRVIQEVIAEIRKMAKTS